ncbi:Hypothetical_protein [Hexamita inflata]|uniref:Hypothetical_protein n=1 Tax=Hexamita inflata TaxID=28002 RepID=A0AA86NQW5_9EUKA|nr:Hypothetical protein HINF_LOCUS2990 [Hexamita inflata]CAI9923734.1 Hypothetical protein HINF_LOCUS11379 [Hexamita inflata]
MFSNHAKSNFAIPRIYVNCLLPLMRWMNSFSYDNFNSELLTSLSAEQLSFINSMHNKQSLPIFQQYTLYLEQRLMSDEISRKMNHWLKYTQKISEEYIIPARKTKYQFLKCSYEFQTRPFTREFGYLKNTYRYPIHQINVNTKAEPNCCQSTRQKSDTGLNQSDNCGRKENPQDYLE